MNKKILVGGCSFTTEEIYDFKVWPVFLGEKLNKKVVNLGKGGKSNGNIAQKLFDYILKNPHEIDSVFVLWTDFWRHDMFNHNFVSPIWQSAISDDGTVPKGYEVQTIHGKTTKQIGSDFIPLNELNKDEKHIHIDSALLMLKSWEYTIKFRSPKKIIETIYNNNFYHMKTVELLCKSLNIPYTAWCAMSQCGRGLRFLWKDEVQSKNESISKSIPIIDNVFDEAENYLNVKNYINWPWKFWMKNDVESKLSINTEDLTYRVSDSDPHPNEKGHEIICREFFNKYVENYYEQKIT